MTTHTQGYTHLFPPHHPQLVCERLATLANIGGDGSGTIILHLKDFMAVQVWDTALSVQGYKYLQSIVVSCAGAVNTWHGRSRTHAPSRTTTFYVWQNNKMKAEDRNCFMWLNRVRRREQEVKDNAMKTAKKKKNKKKKETKQKKSKSKKNKDDGEEDDKEEEEEEEEDEEEEEEEEEEEDEKEEEEEEEEEEEDKKQEDPDYVDGEVVTKVTAVMPNSFWKDGHVLADKEYSVSKEERQKWQEVHA
jgi:outer membrane biosynthesis protein TonB